MTTTTPDQESPLHITINDGDAVEHLTLYSRPVPPDFAFLLGVALERFEAIVRDPLITGHESAAGGVVGAALDNYRSGPTTGAALASHCAHQLRDYVEQAHGMSVMAARMADPREAFAVFATLESEIQNARISSACAAYREMRQQTDATATCKRVLQMLDSTTPANYGERWDPWGA